MGDREELQELRRLAELEAKAGGGATATPDPGIGNVMMNAVPKTAANLLNTPVTLWNLAKQAAGAMHPQIKDYLPGPTPNYPMQAAQSLGLVDPAKEPQTAGQRIADSAIQTGLGALAGPGGMVRNAATGLAAGVAGQATQEVTGSDKAALAAGAVTPFLTRSYSQPPQMNAVAQQTFQEGRKAGFKVPPTEVNPSFFNERLESLAGKAAVKQAANQNNNPIADALTNRYLGVPEGTALTPQSLGQLRQAEGGPFKELGKLRPTPETEYFKRDHDTDLVDQWNQNRADARDSWKAYNRSGGDGSLRDKAKAFEATAESIEEDLKRLAKDNGREDLIDAVAKSRVRIAKSHDVEAALNLGDAGISPPHVASMMNAGKPITGELELIGKYQQAFPGFMREGAVVPSPGVSGTDMAMAAALGVGGYGATDSPYGAAAAALPLMRGPARAFALSNWHQNRLIPKPAEALGDTATRSALIADILAARQQQGVQ
jgi:hypothetical protein